MSLAGFDFCLVFRDRQIRYFARLVFLLKGTYNIMTTCSDCTSLGDLPCWFFSAALTGFLACLIKLIDLSEYSTIRSLVSPRDETSNA